MHYSYSNLFRFFVSLGAVMSPGVALADPEAPSPEFPLTVGGSFWTRYELRANYAEHGLTHPRLHREGDYLVSRARLAITTRPLEVNGLKLSGTFTPQAAYTFGENGGPNPTLSDHPALNLYEGYARVAGKNYQLDAGRFAMNYGEALVIGDLAWNEAARAFNGVRVRLSPSEGGLYVDAFATLLSEGRLDSQAPFGGDRYFYGAYAGLGPLFAKDLDLDVYLLALSTAGTESLRVQAGDTTLSGDLDPATEVTFGARFKGKLLAFDYRVEGGLQGGARPVMPTQSSLEPNNRATFAGQIDAELGVTPVKGLRLGIEGAYATGDDLSTTDKDEGYNELFPTAHKWLGLMDVIGPRTNVLSAALHASYAATEALKIMLDAHYFRRPERNAAGKRGTVGRELNLNVAYALGGGASLRGLYGVFLPRQGFYTSASVTPEDAGRTMHYVEAQFGYDFK